jgi:hypothetical protein
LLPFLTSSRIKNPLVGISKEQLLQDVETFAQEFGLVAEVELLKKGALVAQDPRNADALPELDDEDRRVLREEVTHKWRQPRMLYFTIILNSIAAAIQGWDQTGSNGANLTFGQVLGIPATGDTCDPTLHPENQAMCDKNSWIIGFINSCPYIAICVL